MQSKLDKYLRDRGISQRFMAKELGISANFMNLLVKNKAKPGLEMAYEIEKKTGGEITVYDFLIEEKN